MIITHADAERLLAEEGHQRAMAVSSYLATISQVGALIDRLGELHAELSADDRLHQSLHALEFVWGYVEDELRIAACKKS